MGNTFSALNLAHAMQLQHGILFRGCNHSIIFKLLHSLDLQVAPTAALFKLGSQAVYTTQSPDGYLHWGVASLRVRHGRLTRLDFHQLDCSLVGCSFPRRILLFTLRRRRPLTLPSAKDFTFLSCIFTIVLPWLRAAQ